MKTLCKKYSLLYTGILLASGAALVALPVLSTKAFAQNSKPPALVITNDPLPAELKSQIYSHPSRAPQVSPEQVTGDSYFDNAETVVGKKVTALREDFFELQNTVATLSEKLAMYEQEGQKQSAQYYTDIATINIQLQTGTTPGNPRLIERLTNARESLETLAGNIANLNNLAVEITHSASMSAYLLETANAAYTLAGAVEEDHVRLAQLEDAINSIVVVIDRMLTNVNDDINRTMAYINTERDNLRTLSLAVNSGDLFGRNLTRHTFTDASPANPASVTTRGAFAPDSREAEKQGQPYNPAFRDSRPLVKIRFDKTNVAYEQPLYMAVHEATERFPNAHFALVAVHPTQGNAAQVAIESTKARRNAERVLRSLTQMGVSTEQVDLSYAPSNNVETNEVHLYLR